MTADSRTSIEQLLNELYAGSNCYVIKMICFDIQERERLVNVFVVQLRTRLSIFFYQNYRVIPTKDEFKMDYQFFVSLLNDVTKKTKSV